MLRVAYSYGCVLARLPSLLAEEVRGYAASIPSQYLKRGNEDAPLGVTTMPHVTVKYGIIGDDVELMASIMMNMEPIVVRLGRAGIFHNEDQAVLKLMVESIGLMELNKRICSQVKHVNTFHSYRPHVTVAYLVKKEDDPYYYRTFFSDEFEGREFEVGQVRYSTQSGDHFAISLGDGEVTLIESSME